MLPAPRTDTDAMSEKTPLISTPGNMPLGPKTKDYAMVLLWPFALAVCFAALFIFLVIVPPVHKISLYSVVTLIAMLLPCVPVITAVALVATSVCPRPPHPHAQNRAAQPYAAPARAVFAAAAAAAQSTQSTAVDHARCVSSHGNNRARRWATCTSGLLLWCARSLRATP